MASAAKAKGDKAGQRMAQDRVRIIQQGAWLNSVYFLIYLGLFWNTCIFFHCNFIFSIFINISSPHLTWYFLFLEMKQLESHPMFNPAIKVVDVPQKEKKTLPVNEDKEDIAFNLFEQAEKEPPAEKGSF